MHLLLYIGWTSQRCGPWYLAERVTGYNNSSLYSLENQIVVELTITTWSEFDLLIADNSANSFWFWKVLVKKPFGKTSTNTVYLFHSLEVGIKDVKSRMELTNGRQFIPFIIQNIKIKINPHEMGMSHLKCCVFHIWIPLNLNWEMLLATMIWLFCNSLFVCKSFAIWFNTRHKNLCVIK